MFWPYNEDVVHQACDELCLGDQKNLQFSGQLGTWISHQDELPLAAIDLPLLWNLIAALSFTCWQAVPIMITIYNRKILPSIQFDVVIPLWNHTTTNHYPQPATSSAWEPLWQRSCPMPSCFHHFHSLSCRSRAGLKPTITWGKKKGKFSLAF